MGVLNAVAHPVKRLELGSLYEVELFLREFDPRHKVEGFPYPGDREKIPLSMKNPNSAICGTQTHK